MPEFSYKGRAGGGALVEGTLEAATPEAVAADLAGSGVVALEIHLARGRGGVFEAPRRPLWRRGVTPDELIIFTRQLYSLVKAGVPIVRSLQGLEASSHSRAMTGALHEVVAGLESGHDLASSLARHPEVFPPIFVSTVRVGESSGRLEEALQRIAHYLGVEKETRERIRGALRYPLLVVVAIGVAIAIINIWVIPAFAGVFAKAHVALPWATRVLLATSSFAVAWWPAILGGLGGVLVGARLYLRTAAGRHRWDRLKLRMPVVGSIVHRATLARFARGFSMSLRAGVPLIQGLSVVARAVDNAYLAERILTMRAGIERGDTLTRTAAGTGQFTPLVLQMLAVGEETGQIDALLEEVADFYEREVDYEIGNLSTAIEPFLLVVVGVLVLVLALGVFLPMWDLSTTFRPH